MQPIFAKTMGGLNYYQTEVNKSCRERISVCLNEAGQSTGSHKLTEGHQAPFFLGRGGREVHLRSLILISFFAISTNH